MNPGSVGAGDRLALRSLLTRENRRLSCEFSHSVKKRVLSDVLPPDLAGVLMGVLAANFRQPPGSRICRGKAWNRVMSGCGLRAMRSASARAADPSLRIATRFSASMLIGRRCAQRAAADALREIHQVGLLQGDLQHRPRRRAVVDQRTFEPGDQLAVFAGKLVQQLQVLLADLLPETRRAAAASEPPGSSAPRRVPAACRWSGPGRACASRPLAPVALAALALELALGHPLAFSWPWPWPWPWP